MEFVVKINHAINSVVWGPVALVALLLIGIFFHSDLAFTNNQIQALVEGNYRLTFSNENKPAEKGKITPFRAMATALAGAIGTGNIVGVASAISLGGAGAIFWMWISSILVWQPYLPKMFSV